MPKNAQIWVKGSSDLTLKTSHHSKSQQIPFNLWFDSVVNKIHIKTSPHVERQKMYGYVCKPKKSKK